MDAHAVSSGVRGAAIGRHAPSRVGLAKDIAFPKAGIADSALLTCRKHSLSVRCAAQGSVVGKRLSRGDGFHLFNPNDHLIVADIMTLGSHVVLCKPDTTVDEALTLLVDHRITGMPVVDNDSRLIGVVSDYDLLALDSLTGHPPSSSLFPEPTSTWKAFKEVQRLLAKTHGSLVSDVMSRSPLTVRFNTNLEDAVRLLLNSRFRRLPVVDDAGKVVGLLTRGSIVRAALMMKRAAGTEN